MLLRTAATPLRQKTCRPLLTHHTQAAIAYMGQPTTLYKSERTECSFVGKRSKLRVRRAAHVLQEALRCFVKACVQAMANVKWHQCACEARGHDMMQKQLQKQLQASCVCSVAVGSARRIRRPA